MLVLLRTGPSGTAITRPVSHLPSRASSRPHAAYAENSVSQVSTRRATESREVAPLPVGARVGDFDMVSVIHRGEAGFVYLAADRSSSAKVAVKEYLPNRFADRLADGNIGVRSLRYQTPFRNGMQGFLRQARMLEDLDEPALVKTLRTWQQNGSAYMAMRLC